MLKRRWGDGGLCTYQCDLASQWNIGRQTWDRQVLRTMISADLDPICRGNCCGRVPRSECALSSIGWLSQRVLRHLEADAHIQRSNDCHSGQTLPDFFPAMS